MAVPPRSVASRSWVRRPAEKVPRAGLARSRGGHGAGGWPGAAREMEPRDRAGGRRFGVEGPGGPRRGVLARGRGGLMEREAWPVPYKSFRAWAGKGVSGTSRPQRFPGPGKGEAHPLPGSVSLILNKGVDLFGIRLLGIVLGKEKGPTLLASALGLPGCGGGI